MYRVLLLIKCFPVEMQLRDKVVFLSLMLESVLKINFFIPLVRQLTTNSMIFAIILYVYTSATPR